MDSDGLNKRLVEKWQTAAQDLGIRITAPVELQDAAGNAFVCEALVHDFACPSGGLVVSPKTERRVRQHLRSLGDRVWVGRSQQRESKSYGRKYFIDELVDWGWFGPLGEEPSWYRR